MDRLCSRCQQVKAPEEFYGPRRTWCKQCFRQYVATRRLALNPPKPKLPDGLKRCPRCQEVLSLENFRSRATGRPYAYCHQCWREKSEEIRKSHVQALRGPLGSEWAGWRATGVKWCRRCGQEKPVAKFHCLKAGVPSVYCRQCTADAHARWMRTAAGQASARKYNLGPGRRHKNDVRVLTQKAIRVGMLTKGPCETAGCDKPPEAHHEDYTKPLEVRWLCREHHRARHDAMKSPLD